jgi:hypothetical protein
MQHKTRTYKDGNKTVEYCCVCGLEDLELLSVECYGEYQDKNNNRVDKKKIND